MSSCSGIGLSSSTSIFSGGLCSGTTRRPSMFTAKYRLREERKKVLKVSLNKVRRIEDPESFLRRSVLINNTVKRLQREVREEKMVRNGGYMSKLSSMHSFRKSFASSRLQELVHADDLIDDSSSLYGPPSSFSNQHNSRKRPLTEDPESDVEEVLSQIYIPPTPPCIISAIEEGGSRPPTPISLECLSASPSSSSHDGEIKKARMTIEGGQGHEVTVSSHPLVSPAPVPDLAVEDFEIDVDVVGGSKSSWDNATSTTQTNLNSNETGDEVMDEFRLDFHLTSPTSTTGLDVLEDKSCDPSSPKICEESKENKCESSPMSSSSSCCPPGLNVSVPLADLPVHQHKCPNSVGTSGPLGTPETNTSSAAEKQQFSSCGHSSIFGELQSVVFHSLIASLET